MAQLLTPAEAQAQIDNSRLTGTKRFRIHRREDGYSVRDHEWAEWIPNADNRETYSREHAEALLAHMLRTER